MNIQDLFIHQQDVAEKLKTVLRDRGYTKVSFSKQLGITRPTLDTILNGECSSTTKYNSYFEKILDVLTLSPASLYSVRVTAPMVSAVYSSNAPADYIPSEKEKKQCDLLENLLALASTYCSY